MPLAPTEEKLKGSTESLQIMSESYKKLQEVERKLDWNVSRRKVELAETLGPARAAGVSLRFIRSGYSHPTSYS